MVQSGATQESAQTVIQDLKQAIEGRLFGLERVVDEMLIALMARGHILLEDVPGVGKTALAKTFADTLGLSFRRVQCTPDLLPADIVGGLVFHPGDTAFILRKGPIFTHLLLVDEINRALPRTQSALLEAMAEGQVTIDGETHRLPEPFLVIATQNPLESQGVFPLPEAQLDRFLLKTSLGYPSPDEDIALLSLHLSAADPDLVSSGADRASDGGLSALRTAVNRVQVSPVVLEYISSVVRATRTQPDVDVGASPRAMIMLAKAARAAAVLSGRDFVTPDDVQRVATSVLFHRLVLWEPAGASGVDPAKWMQNLLATVDVPIERDIR